MKLLSIKKVVELVDFHAKTIRGWVTEGKFPAPVDTPSGDQRWYEFEVMMWIANRTRAKAVKEKAV